ncbi:MAG TPA: 4-hydroxy-tetrahydrodipicolinate reductase [Myxococcaceae bacterium]|nr:4-hydroxy-tetrahydrodipicolinate reductase [Myxococcaceae bacterium]
MSGGARLAIAGLGGRMGQALVRCSTHQEGLTLVGGTERREDLDLPGLPSGVTVKPTLSELLAAEKVDVVIDFTVAEAAAEHARACAEAGVGLVLGTTGLDDAGRAALDAAAARIPIVAAPNFSVGVYVLARLATEATRLLGPDFDAEVLEIHHRMKRDAPSGTALRLAEAVTEARGVGREVYRTTRDGLIGARPRGELGLQTLRGGDVVGEHTVFLFGDGERVELTHRATSRDTFANGALRAARWLSGRPPGMHGLGDVLGLGRD